MVVNQSRSLADKTLNVLLVDYITGHDKRDWLCYLPPPTIIRRESLPAMCDKSFINLINIIIMRNVQIVPSKEGQLITVYKNKSDYGYITLSSTELSTDARGWLRESKRSTLMRATVDLLQKYIAMNKSLTVPGKIYVEEFLESDVPDSFRERFNKNVDYETQIRPYIKRAGKDGIELTLGGERILRFTSYDQSGTMEDSKIAHDNTDAVRASKGAASAADFDGESADAPL
jgi:hypothetical protein